MKLFFYQTALFIQEGEKQGYAGVSMLKIAKILVVGLYI